MPRKGQVFSAEAKQKKRQTVWLGELSQFDWSKAEPFLDQKLDTSSRNRSLKFLTLGEFKLLATNGLSIRSLREQGYCKHLLQFYSNFLKGKISLSKEEFEAEYLSGKSLDDICQKFSITRGDVIFLRQMYGIRTLGAKFQHRKHTEESLTQRQKDLVYGSLMGDAKRMSPSSVAFGHGTKQQEYLMWKYHELRNLCSPDSVRIMTYTDSRSGSHLIDGRFYTKANTEIETILEQFYESGTKEITEEILANLSDFSLAVWYMDDGSTDMYRRFQNKNINPSPLFSFCTESFSAQSCANIQKWFVEKWNIDTRLRPRKNSLGEFIGQRLLIELDSNEKFLDMIRPHILPMFAYKIDYEAYCASMIGR